MHTVFFYLVLLGFTALSREDSLARPAYSTQVAEQREQLLKEMQTHLELGQKEMSSLRKVFKRSGAISQGNPEVSRYAMQRSSCQKQKIDYSIKGAKSICDGKPYMAPLYDPQTESAKDARVCIDQFEFPNIPCAYPVVWTKASDAAAFCQALGKRLCDTHEWEGGCAGRLLPPDYRFDLVKKGMSLTEKHAALRSAHNRARKRIWAYGPKKNHALCATSSRKSKGCSMNSHKSEWRTCGSNFYPAGSFPLCKSKLGVYDQHGNAAEAMNIPFAPDQLASRGSLGYTELKGSWYIFNNYEAHRDDCRWRAPFWHGASIQASHDAHNHLGFRCCSDVGGSKPKKTQPN